jgi:hypothetical protein
MGSRSGGKALLSCRRLVHVLPYQVHREYEDPLFHWSSLRAWLQASQGMEWTARACGSVFIPRSSMRQGFVLDFARPKNHVCGMKCNGFRISFHCLLSGKTDLPRSPLAVFQDAPAFQVAGVKLPFHCFHFWCCTPLAHHPCLPRTGKRHVATALPGLDRPTQALMWYR